MYLLEVVVGVVDSVVSVLGKISVRLVIVVKSLGDEQSEYLVAVVQQGVRRPPRRGIPA